jgi:ABC-type polysaccharide/polyol phosphate transport system ATPase subunit
MSIEIEACSKSFMSSGRSRRPLYRELLMLRSRRRQHGARYGARKRWPRDSQWLQGWLVGRNGAESQRCCASSPASTSQTGQIRVDGRVCCFFEPGAARRPLSVRDNAFLYASLAGLGYGDTRDSLPRILDFCSLSEQEFTWVEHLSFGMQQRLFLSIMLEVMRLKRADVFLFDEFLMGVDRTFRTRVEEALTTLPSSGQIIVHASHDQDLMLRTCPQSILLVDGAVRHFGPTEEVLEIYQRD